MVWGPRPAHPVRIHMAPEASPQKKSGRPARPAWRAGSQYHILYNILYIIHNILDILYKILYFPYWTALFFPIGWHCVLVKSWALAGAQGSCDFAKPDAPGAKPDALRGPGSKPDAPPALGPLAAQVPSNRKNIGFYMKSRILYI